MFSILTTHQQSHWTLEGDRNFTVQLRLEYHQSTWRRRRKRPVWRQLKSMRFNKQISHLSEVRAFPRFQAWCLIQWDTPPLLTAPVSWFTCIVLHKLWWFTKVRDYHQFNKHQASSLLWIVAKQQRGCCRSSIAHTLARPTGLK